MGSCNFSELENVKLNIKLADSDIRFFSLETDIPEADRTIDVGPDNNLMRSIYGINYNVFFIEDGMSELMYGM
jgi:hypothetical protein